MTKLSNADARFSALSLVQTPSNGQNPRRIMSHFQHIRPELARAIQPVPEIGHSDGSRSELRQQ
jgi:hypothetical protein